MHSHKSPAVSPHAGQQLGDTLPWADNYTVRASKLHQLTVKARGFVENTHNWKRGQCELFFLSD